MSVDPSDILRIVVMKKEHRDFINFLEKMVFGGNGLFKYQEMMIEDYLDEHFKEKANEEVYGESYIKLKPCRVRKLPDGSFTGACFREC